MTSSAASVLAGLRGDDRTPGARRRKLNALVNAGRARASEAYRNWAAAGTYDDSLPGSFPDEAVIRGSGDEELVLFSSYARRHRPGSYVGSTHTNEEYGYSGQNPQGEEFWRSEFERHEDEHAVVDIDVRGWVYTPHHGPLNRKNRLFVGIARQLVGLPATVSASASRDTSPSGSSRREEALAQREAEAIANKGRQEADVAVRGGYSETPTDSADEDSVYEDRGKKGYDREPPGPGHLKETITDSSLRPEGLRTALERRKSWIDPTNMSAAELSVANNHLMTRLRPFFAVPVVQSPISAFFYNDTQSLLKTIDTDAVGHFSLRAALDFVPTHVRVLASEGLSFTEEVQITEDVGISIISDIDDTVKHSDIGSGAREIFRNTFIRELDDLTVPGVQEWYTKMADLGVKMHYVSNSPWPLYPLLMRFFTLAGLPRGSFHLKQYSGMLQGIFEPVAERKKATLERIFRDFPDRRFILVGDSGEADLEVYTDVVLEHPKRVLAICIRDVTTMSSEGPYDPPFPPPREGHHQATNGSSRPESIRSYHTSAAVDDDEDPALKAAIAASLDDAQKAAQHRKGSSSSNRAPSPPPPRGRRRSSNGLPPPLPPRRRADPVTARDSNQMGGALGELIDLSEPAVEEAEPTTHLPPAPPGSDFRPSPSPGPGKTGGAGPPPPPRKPENLRSPSPPAESPRSPPLNSNSNSNGKTPPPIPRKPLVHRPAGNDTAQASIETSPSVNIEPPTPATRTKPRAPLPPPPRTFTSSSTTTTTGGTASRTTAIHPSDIPADDADTKMEMPPRPPPRRAITSLSQNATQSQGQHYTASRLAGTYESRPRPGGAGGSQASSRGASPARSTLGFSTTVPGSTPASTIVGGNVPLSKKEEVWRRRWLRAQEVLEPHGVVLRPWRTGDDVMHTCAELVGRQMDEDERRS